MVPEAVDAMEAEWASKPSLRQLVWIFFFGFEPPLPGNSDAKLAILWLAIFGMHTR